MRHIRILRLLAYITAITMLAALALLVRAPAQELEQESSHPVLLSIAVTPADASILPDRDIQFTATGTFSDGSSHDLTWSVTWSSSVLDVATINRVGNTRALAVGRTTIEAALGAINGSATLNVVLSGTFDLTGSMETGRYVHTATLLNNGMVLVAGGCCPSLPTAELYNPATGSFTPTGSMTAPYALATLLNNGMVLIEGGGAAGLPGGELYNPLTGSFSYTNGKMSTPRDWHTATLLKNGLVLMAGGIDSNYNALASAELYDPATGTFTPTGSLNNARAGHTATPLNNGMVLMAGGCTGYCSPGYTNSPSVVEGELYNPATGTFTPTGSLNTARTRHRASLLTNGMVLMAGGADYWLVNFGESLGSAEVYDPATGTFTPTSSSLNDARYWETATLLNNGLVLIAGGVGMYQYEASAELYEPVLCPPPHLKSIAIKPERSTLSPGQTQRFIAIGKFSDGTTQQLASVTWSSSKPAVAQISNDASNPGVGLAIAAGTVMIEARAVWVRGWARLTVQ